MQPLLGIHSLSKAYGTQELFDDLSFTVFPQDRIGLIGPNGSGKSTLLKILKGAEPPDSGSVTRRQGLTLGYAGQSPEFPSLPLEEVLIENGGRGDSEAIRTRARILLGKVGFDDLSQNAAELSGGWKKRLDIARALMQEPDLLLLDEPTNHLDLDGILWLEKFLNRERFSYIVVSHDRYFLENIATRMIEINRCYPQGMLSSSGNMSAFMAQKEAFLEAQKQQQRGLQSTLRDEIEWMRKSPKARTTKSKSRLDRAYEMIDELSDLKNRNKTTRVAIDFSASERESRKLIVSKNLTKGLGGKNLFTGIDLTLSPGSRLGIVGSNGTGKTTLLRVLGGQIPQDMGTLKYADDLKIVYFDQHREQIPLDISLKRALSPSSDMLSYRGTPIHVNGWAKRFLFTPDRLELPVGCLSGGERARILIAKLMLEPADVLFLDEPTNDLDIPTLEVFEESLNEFAGAVVMISHDRCLMDRVCNQIIGLGEGLEGQLFADFGQWEQACAQSKALEKQKKAPQTVVAKATNPKKLTYKEQLELEKMEPLIAEAEKEITALQNKLGDAALATDPQKALDLYKALADAELKLESLFERWQFLEAKTL